MRRYSTRELSSFLSAVDAELQRRCTIVLIGGGAVGLAYEGKHATTDLDLWSVSEPGFWKAVERAQASSAVDVPVQKAAIAEPPYDFEDRLWSLPLPGLARLTVLVPEVHDLVLMKTARGEAHDLDAIEELHRKVGLRLEVLLERFHETKGQVTGPPNRFRLNFQAVVARIFGEATADAIASRL